MYLLAKCLVRFQCACTCMCTGIGLVLLQNDALMLDSVVGSPTTNKVCVDMATHILYCIVCSAGLINI